MFNYVLPVEKKLSVEARIFNQPVFAFSQDRYIGFPLKPQYYQSLSKKDAFMYHLCV